jgi:hypothetical protein
MPTYLVLHFGIWVLKYYLKSKGEGRGMQQDYSRDPVGFTRDNEKPAPQKKRCTFFS